MLGKNFDFTPSASDEPMGAVFVNFKKGKRFRESKIETLPPETESGFDDTFRDNPETRQRRLREHAGMFSRGVPTDGMTSTQNYDKGKIKLIDGEHKSLLSLGRINEAFEDDDHSGHIMEHRMLLSDPKLTETQRNALMEHIAGHQKIQGKRLKAAESKQKEAAKARKDIMQQVGHRAGFGMSSKALPAVQDDVIPQDAQVDTERKRTAGNMAMEAKFSRFDRALRASGLGLRNRRRSL